MGYMIYLFTYLYDRFEALSDNPVCGLYMP
jgi:hypothetical protein